MLIGIPRESLANERRVAATPESVGKLVKLGYQVAVESGAGEAASFPDEAYQAAGARVLDPGRSVLGEAEIVCKVQPPTIDEAGHLKEGAILVSLLWPARNQQILQRLGARHVTALAMDCVPRISRAQKLDVLSSMANIAGYRAVLEAAAAYGGFFTGQITAAGRVPPAKVLIIGAGVAGLAAIGAARSLGAIVRAFDTRPEVKDQVKSMGAEFLELKFEEEGSGEGGYARVMSPAFIKAEMELFAKQAREVDIIVTTALVPGAKAPRLIVADTARSMKPGSVIVDLAAEQGGNCELTVPGEAIKDHGVTIIGYTDLASRLPSTASQLYANNLVHLFSDIGKDGHLKLDLEDEVTRGMLVLERGELRWPPPKKDKEPPKVTPPAGAPAGAPPTPVKGEAGPPSALRQTWMAAVFWAIAGSLLVVVGRYAPPAFLGHLTVFVLACFIGWQVVWNVNPALHTPLMSVTNAISGIIVVGAILQLRAEAPVLVTALAGLAVLVATINIAGGFLVTHRMLKMFRKGAR